jgi:glutathione S-transferase
MKTLHYYPSNASFAPHVLLHELNVPFALQRVDRDNGETVQPPTGGSTRTGRYRCW